MKPRSRLQDMPYPVMKRICKHLEYYYVKMSLKTAYPQFVPFLVNPSPAKASCELVLCESGHVELVVKEDSEVISKTYSDHVHKRQDHIGDLTLAAEHFKMLVDNPNFKLFGLTVTVEEGARSSFLWDIQRILENLKTKLSVKVFRMFYGGDESDVLRILRHIDPEYLWQLRLMSNRKNQMHQLDQVMKTEHWARVERIFAFSNLGNTLPVDLFFKNTRPGMRMEILRLEHFSKILKNCRSAPSFVNWRSNSIFEDLDIARAMGGGFEALETGHQYAYFDKADKKNAVHVYIRYGHVEISSRSLGWEDEEDSDSSDSESDEEEDSEEEE